MHKWHQNLLTYQRFSQKISTGRHIEHGRHNEKGRSDNERH